MFPTITFDDGDTTVTVLRGHADIDTFREALKLEGYPGLTRMIGETEIKHEWWVKTKDGWKESEMGCSVALPVTVLRW